MLTKEMLNYREIANIPAFCRQVKEEEKNYRYIVARERRGFNIFYSSGIREGKLLNVSGLLANARKIAEEYADTGVFPRVLILDDLAVYGRGISKSVHQFRSLVYDLLEDMHPGKFSEGRFAGDFQQSVDVWVYAASEKARLLETGPFSFRTFSGSFSSMLSIHDMSMQFSKLLAELSIANTSISFSTWCSRAWKLRLSSSKAVPAGWSRVSLDYEGDRAIVYLKPCGGSVIQRFETLRFFPNQGEEEIRITSFPLLRALDGATTNKLCRAALQFSKEKDFPVIGKLLAESHQYLQPVKAQLLMFTVSMLDFFDFCDDFFNEIERKTILGHAACDVRKIASNFGGEDILPELRRITFSRSLRQQLSQMLEPFLNGPETPLLYREPGDFAGLDIHMEDIPQGKHWIDEVARNIWTMGCQDEKAAMEVTDQPYWFEALYYRESGCTLGQLLEELDADELDGEEICGQVAVRLVTMDRGLEGPMVNVDTDGRMQVSLKVGELSTFYPMKKNAAWIPALVRVEEFYYLHYRTKKEAVKAFLEKYDGYDEDLLKIYEYGQNFADWNFPNLVRSFGDPEKVSQHKCEAKAFLSLPENG